MCEGGNSISFKQHLILRGCNAVAAVIASVAVLFVCGETVKGAGWQLWLLLLWFVFSFLAELLRRGHYSRGTVLMGLVFLLMDTYLTVSTVSMIGASLVSAILLAGWFSFVHTLVIGYWGLLPAFVAGGALFNAAGLMEGAFGVYGTLILRAVAAGGICGLGWHYGGKPLLAFFAEGGGHDTGAVASAAAVRKDSNVVEKEKQLHSQIEGLEAQLLKISEERDALLDEMDKLKEAVPASAASGANERREVGGNEDDGSTLRVMTERIEELEKELEDTRKRLKRSEAEQASMSRELMSVMMPDSNKQKEKEKQQENLTADGTDSTDK